MLGCICGGLVEGLIALMLIFFSFIFGKMTTVCRERCCLQKKAIDDSLKRYNEIKGYNDGSDG